MEIPGLGPVTVDADFDGYRSAPLPIPAFGGASCQLVLVGYDGDERKDEFHAAVSAFLGLDETALHAAGQPIFEYYQDVTAGLAEAEALVTIAGPDQLWQHVYIRSGTEVTVERDDFPDDHVYVSVECECAWEPEHGLQIVFRAGRSVTKVGPFDGHLTNASAYGRADLDTVVYHRPG